MLDADNTPLPEGKRLESPASGPVLPDLGFAWKTAALLWRHRLLTGVVILAATAAAYRAAPLLLGPVVEADAVRREIFVQRIVASGHVETPFRTNVASQVVGTVAEVPVAEGQTVRAGDPLVILDRREAQAAVAQAESALAQGEARVRQLREVGLPTAEAVLKQAQASAAEADRAYDRAVQLSKDGFQSKAALDDAAKAREAARAQLRSAALQVASNRTGGSDYDMAQYQLAQARSALDLARIRLGYTVIAAPSDGVLIARNVERGNVVQPSNVLMVLSPSTDTRLVVQIDERNLGVVAVGQNALASADAYPGQTFAAAVDFINSGVDVQRASIEVKLRVPSPPAFLREDMTVSVDIETARRPDALVIPAQDLHDAGRNPWVLMAEGGHARRRPVKVGLLNTGYAEILGGLKEGDLLLPASARLTPDARVRVRPRPPAR